MWFSFVCYGQAYVFFFAEMGGIWLERHLSIVLSHFVDLLANPKAVTTHVDSVYSRKCVGFIIQYTFSRLLGETAQLSACSHLCNLVLKCCQAQSSTHDGMIWADSYYTLHVPIHIHN